MSDRRWTIENAPSPPYDWHRKALVIGKGWYVHVGCSDADQMMFDGIEPCCDLMVFGPFPSKAEADEAGMDLTVDTGPWYYTLEEA